MVSIVRHGDIKLADKPCRTSAHFTGNTCNTQASCTDGRESKSKKSKPKPNHTSAPESVVGNKPFSSRNQDNQGCHESTLPCTYDHHNHHYVQSETRLSSHTLCKYSKSSICLSLDEDLDAPSHHKDPTQSPDTLPYLELPVESRDSYSYLAASSNLWRQSQFYSRGSSFGSRNLTFSFLWFLLSMSLLCKSCVCMLCSDDSDRVSTFVRPQYLTFINETNLLGVSGQCLTLTGSLADDLCQQPAQDPNQRMESFLDTRTNFCGLPLSTIMSPEDVKDVLCARESCAHVLSAVQELEEELSDMYCQFEDVLDRIDCADTFSTMGDCNKCKEAYKQWLCSVYHMYYFNGQQIKPCMAICDQVSESCPFFRPHGETLIGEPGFLCKDSKSSLAEDTAVVYGQESCCYRPCLLSTDEACPQYNITSNCTVQATSSSTSISHSYSTNTDIVTVLLCCIASSVYLTIFPKYTCIGLT